MKLTSSQLKQIIKEELGYDDPEVSKYNEARRKVLEALGGYISHDSMVEVLRRILDSLENA